MNYDNTSFVMPGLKSNLGPVMTWTSSAWQNTELCSHNSTIEGLVFARSCCKSESSNTYFPIVILYLHTQGNGFVFFYSLTILYRVFSYIHCLVCADGVQILSSLFMVNICSDSFWPGRNMYYKFYAGLT